MSPRARNLGTNTALAFGGDLLARGGMFAALLLLARALSLAEYARLGVAMSAMLIMTSLLDGGVALIGTRDGAARAELRRELLRAGIWARLPLVAIAAVACLGGGALLGQLELGAAVLVCAIVNAAQIALFALFRSAQTLVNEALAKAVCGASYPLCCAGFDATGHRSASAALLAMTIGPAATLPPLMLAARRATTPARGNVTPAVLLRRAAPFGLISLATLAYYRAPLLVLGLLSTHAQTASYSVAANIAFGLLMLPAAFATGLLPRLSAEPDPARRAALLRRSLLASTAIVTVVVALVGSGSWWLVPRLYGHAYRGAVVPLLILLASCVVIGASGLVGTALIAAERRRTVVTQVVVALCVNLAVDAAAIPALGAAGAALATLVTEFVGLALLATAYVGRGGLRRAPEKSRAAEPAYAP